jgi:hypothetical protein
LRVSSTPRGVPPPAPDTKPRTSPRDHPSGPVGSGVVHLKCAVKSVPSGIETLDIQRYRQELLRSVALFAQPRAKLEIRDFTKTAVHTAAKKLQRAGKGARGQVAPQSASGRTARSPARRRGIRPPVGPHDGSMARSSSGGRFGSCLDQADRRFWWWTACKPESSGNSGVPPRALGAADRQSRPRSLNHPSTAGATSVLGAREVFPDKDAWPPEEQSLSGHLLNRDARRWGRASTNNFESAPFAMSAATLFDLE